MLLALLAIACDTDTDTAAPVEPPPDRPDAIHYIGAGVETPITLGSGAVYAVECADPGALVAVDADGHLCSVVDGAWLDADGDGLCDLAPPVDLVVEVR